MINRSQLHSFLSLHDLHHLFCSIFTLLNRPSKPNSLRLHPLITHPWKRLPHPHHHSPTAFSLPSLLMSGIYCALVHSSPPVTHALWVDAGRIQFVRYYVLILVLCGPRLSSPPPTSVRPWQVLIDPNAWFLGSSSSSSQKPVWASIRVGGLRPAVSTRRCICCWKPSAPHLRVILWSRLGGPARVKKYNLKSENPLL